MKEVKDRMPKYPGRVKMIAVPGQPDTYDMVRADDPTEPGTPINRALFESIKTDINDAIQAIDNKVFEFSQWSEVGTLADGASFGLYENGVLNQYVKLKDNYEGTGRVLVVRRGITHHAALYTTGKIYYSQTDVDAWLNGDFLARLDANTRNAITEVPIDVWTSDGDGTINRRAFLLTTTEYQLHNIEYMQWLGDPIAIFDSDAKRVALFNGAPSTHHTRSGISDYDTYGLITVDGEGTTVRKDTVAGVRPAFTLPADFEVTVATYSTANMVATAEVI